MAGGRGICQPLEGAVWSPYCDRQLGLLAPVPRGQGLHRPGVLVMPNHGAATQSQGALPHWVDRHMYSLGEVGKCGSRDNLSVITVCPSKYIQSTKKAFPDLGEENRGVELSVDRVPIWTL